MRALFLAFVLLALVAVPSTSAVVTQSISIVNFGYQPQVAVARIGQPVVWTNDGASPHTVTAVDGTFNSGAITPGGSYARTFALPATVMYRCTFHQQMFAVLVVVA